MERLTRYDKDGRVQIKVFNGSIGGSYEYPLISSSVTRRAIDRLAELEDKLESGELLDIPFKVGDEVWMLDAPDCTAEIIHTKVRDIVYGRGTLQIVCPCDEYRTYCVKATSVFSTKEAAEARLKELQEQKK